MFTATHERKLVPSTICSWRDDDDDNDDVNDDDDNNNDDDDDDGDDDGGSSSGGSTDVRRLAIKVAITSEDCTAGFL